MRARRHAQDLQRQLSEAQRRIAELEHRLETVALRDPLTGLASLHAFDRHLDAAVARSRRHGDKLSLAAVDIDAFRGINARYGRETGDEVLKTVASRLLSLAPAGDLVTRSSADEFLVLLPERGALESAEQFVRLQRELEKVRVNELECVSASIGLAEYKLPMTADDLIAAAGDRLRRARLNGGGRTEAQPVSLDRVLPGDTIAGLAEALLERDRYTGEHSEHVAEMATEVARAMGLDEREVERVRGAALLHDIGKVGIPDDILRKGTELTEPEWRTMREHPIIGERIVRTIPGLGPVARIVRHEHERWDGAGYPDGLSGEEIPIGARIIQACDAYHAMTSDRPYRKALSHAEAVRELAAGAATQFDHQVTEILIGRLWANRQLAAGAAA
ncbi:MAG TPA: diguanylate cyclase [Thermoleophilaceae bacterium]|nr:diguanylate cyclase [Thermoleophilaceae bacterium]